MKNEPVQISSFKYSVIVPSCRRPLMLKSALDSIVEQTVGPMTIYLVIDECEGENDYSFLLEYQSLLRTTFTGGRLGGAAARNIGLEQVGDEEYVFFLDDDDTWCPEKIERQIKCLALDEDCVGVTCWNYNIADKTTQVERASEKQINQNIKVWNTLGSFSFFGYRLTSDTRRLRVSERLQAAQDWEFYIRLSQYGEFKVVEDYMALYHEHNEARITGNSSKKSEAWEWVYAQHRHHLKQRQRWLHLARINWKYSEAAQSVMAKCGFSLKAITLSIIASHRTYSRKVIVSSTTSVLRGMGLKK